MRSYILIPLCPLLYVHTKAVDKVSTARPIPTNVAVRPADDAGSHPLAALIISSVMPAASAYCGKCQTIVASSAPIAQAHAMPG